MKYKNIALLLLGATSLFSSLSSQQVVRQYYYQPAQPQYYPYQTQTTPYYYPPQPQYQPYQIQTTQYYPHQTQSTQYYYPPQPQYQPQQQPRAQKEVIREHRYRDSYEEDYYRSNLEKQQRRSMNREQKKAVKSIQHKLHTFAKRDKFIWFYDEENSITSFLGNYYPTAVNIWGMQFQCAEAAYQAAKYVHRPELVSKFTRLNGEEAWKLGRKLKHHRRDDWFQVRDGVMLQVVRAKFQQNPTLAQLLVATEKAYLVEHTSRDRVWGDGGNGEGENRLGSILMQIRGEMGGAGVVPKPSQYWKFVQK